MPSIESSPIALVNAAFACLLSPRSKSKRPSWKEAIASFVLIPAAFWVGSGWVETALLAGSVVFVLVVELLNTAVESAIDRIGPQWHDLSKRAKDMGSAAVLLSLLFAMGVWSAALWARFT